MSHKLSVFGLGYVGLATAACFASRRTPVIGVDIDEEKVDLVNKGKSPVYEKGLEGIIRKSVNLGMLKATADPYEAVSNTGISMITVGTPLGSDGRINLKPCKEVSRQVGEVLREKKGYRVIAIKSTVPPGTTQNIVKAILEKSSGKRCGEEFGLVVNPEFLREGHAVEDTLKPSRIIIGAEEGKSEGLVIKFYKKVYGKKMPPLVKTNPQTAELVKYASNAFLALKVSFINEIADLASRVPGVDVKTVAAGMGFDPRISPHFLRAGLGYGGSCLPKDLQVLISTAQDLGLNPIILKATSEVNDQRPKQLLGMVQGSLGGIKGRRIAILGLAFKPDTDDLRDAVSIKVVENLLGEGATVVVHDPMALADFKRIFAERVEYAETARDCIQGADCAVMVTEWKEYERLRASDFKRRMKEPILIDGRRVFDPKNFIGQIDFHAIGLGT